MDKERPLILITNDDGIDALGLHKLADIVSSMGDVYIVAPQTPQSGKSASMTSSSPLRILENRSRVDGVKIFMVNGTPVDCIKISIHAIVPRRPSVILSGINHGSNSGVNITYSGTMGAVLEGCIEGIASVGFSLMDDSKDADFSKSRYFIRNIVEKVLCNGLPQGICLNVNIPAKVNLRGIRVCRAAQGKWVEGYKRYIDPYGEQYYLLTGRFLNFEPEATDTDEYWLLQKYISVVPVKCDLSARTQISTLANIFDLK